MRLSLKVLAPAALLIAGLAVTSAEAAPAGSGLAPLGNAPEAASVAEKTYWVRRCYRVRHGVRCHRVWVKPHRWHRPYRHYRRW
jgi:hypothetical protein